MRRAATLIWLGPGTAEPQLPTAEARRRGCPKRRIGVMKTFAWAEAFFAICLVLYGGFGHARTDSGTNPPTDVVDEAFVAGMTQRPLADRKAILAQLYHEGRFEDVRIAHRGLLDDSQDKDVLFIVGKSLAALGKTQDGIRLLERAAKEDTQNGRPFYEIGRLFIRLGDRRGGTRYLRRAIDADPQLTEAYYQLALHSIDTAEARKACEQVLILEERGSELAKKALVTLRTRLKENPSQAAP